MPLQQIRNHKTIGQLDAYLAIAAEGFLRDRQAAGKTRGTLAFYWHHLKDFINYCDAQSLTQVTDLSPDFLRGYLLTLAEGHNPGGIHAHYRALRAFLRWIEYEDIMPAGWRNPIHRVKAPKVPEQLLEPVQLEDVRALIGACKRGRQAERDKAIFLLLLDTGIRAGELIRIDRRDVDLAAGALSIPKSKSGKPRIVYIGRATRRALRASLRARHDTCPALFVTASADPLSYNGLRELLRRRARDAGIPAPTLHQFRRAFALNFLRNGGDIFSLQKLMGHSDLSVLKKYLKLTDLDAQIAHARYSPVDSL